MDLETLMKLYTQFKAEVPLPEHAVIGWLFGAVLIASLGAALLRVLRGKPYAAVWTAVPKLGRSLVGTFRAVSEKLAEEIHDPMEDEHRFLGHGKHLAALGSDYVGFFLLLEVAFGTPVLAAVGTARMGGAYLLLAFFVAAVVWMAGWFKAQAGRDHTAYRQWRAQRC